MASGISELDVLVKSMCPRLLEGVYVFSSIEGGTLKDVVGMDPLCTFNEKEGLTVVVPAHVAVSNNLISSGKYCMITLDVHSSLDAVGLTAVVSRVLAKAGISANVIAGYFHDHIFVQEERAADAMVVLEKLSADESAAQL